MIQYPQKTIYLAGPITGVTYGESRHGWREEFDRVLHGTNHLGRQHNIHIHCISPMRGEELLERAQVVEPKSEYESQHHIENPRGILTRDENDVTHCDLIVANFLGAQRVSIGTCCEFGMARILRKPVVLIMEKEGNPHHHGFITEIACYWVDTLERAADVAQTLLTPGV